MAREKSKRIVVRRENLEKAIALAGGSAAKLSKKCDISASEISQMLNLEHPRNVGDIAAEKIEKGLELSFGWMDQIHDEHNEEIDISSLISVATPNTHKRLVDIQNDINNGTLSNEDIEALYEIAKRLKKGN